MAITSPLLPERRFPASCRQVKSVGQHRQPSSPRARRRQVHRMAGTCEPKRFRDSAVPGKYRGRVDPQRQGEQLHIEDAFAEPYAQWPLALQQQRQTSAAACRTWPMVSNYASQPLSTAAVALMAPISTGSGGPSTAFNKDRTKNTGSRQEASSPTHTGGVFASTKPSSHQCRLAIAGRRNDGHDPITHGQGHNRPPRNRGRRLIRGRPLDYRLGGRRSEMGPAKCRFWMGHFLRWHAKTLFHT